LYKEIKRVAKELRNTPFALLLTAYETWLYRLSGIEDFVIGVPFAGQGALQLNTLVGQCVHTLPFRAKVEDGASFVDQLTKTRKLILDTQEYWNSNFGTIVQKLNLPSDPSRVPLVPVMFNLDPPLNDVQFSGCVSRITSGPRFYFYYDLGFNVVDEGDTLLVECDYNSNLFDDETIRNWLGGFQAVLEGIVSNPKLPLSRLPILSETERRQRLAERDASHRDFPCQETIHGLVSAQVARSPNAIAVECADQQLTYAELDKRSSQLANYLRAQGVGPNTVVAVCLNRSLDMVVGALGALKAGAAFAQIDPECPIHRMTFILEDSMAAVLLTHENLLARLPRETCANVVCLERDSGDISGHRVHLDPTTGVSEDLAYVCYTSGSTGGPKGVEVSHKAVVNFLYSMARAPGLGKDDVMLALTTFSFDIAILEIFLPLIVGARIAIVTPQVLVDPVDLDDAITRHGVTVMQATPTTWRMVLNAGWKGKRGLRVLCGGESLSSPLAAQLLACCGEVWNMYGPTETTVWSTICKLETGQSVTIGRPIANTQVYIVDDHFEPVPAGVPGELLIGGAGVAHQYRNLPDLTAEMFVPYPSAEGGRLFRTGDIGRYRSDGEIQLVGRRDSQVKLRGHRIEFGEIESVLLDHPQVGEAVVTLREDTPEDPRMVAYVSCIGGKDVAKILPSQLRQLVRSKVPAYMVPSTFLVLERLPRTPVGKLDRTSLPPPSSEGLEVFEDEYAAPRNETEVRLNRLWCETLKLGKVSCQANFFDLGGHSVLAVILFAKIQKEFDKKLPLATLFSSPTIEGLAVALQGENTETSWSSLVPIQPKGSKPPLFLVHGAGGNVLLYRSLGEHLAPQYPLYGLQSRGLDGESEPLRTIEEMALCYLLEVKNIQPQGPYHLGGYCLGGTIAYEMAQILRRQGEDVPLVALLDTYNFSRALKVSMQSFLIQKFKFHFANLLRLRPHDMITYLREKIRLALGGELANLRTSMPGSGRADGVGRATVGVEAKIQAINDYAAEHYDPKPYPGRLALFKPRFNYKFYPDPKMGWGDLVLGGLEFVEVAVNPHSMLLEPYVPVLAAQLKERIDGAHSVPPVLQPCEAQETELDQSAQSSSMKNVVMALPNGEAARHRFSLLGGGLNK
jgi:amino acid adenylation domain-containing protein